jgi:predicted dehydrogenase
MQPKTVNGFCQYGKWHDIEVEDDVTAYAEYENGATGTFITTTGDAPGTNRFEVVCDGGTLLCEDGKKLTLKKLSMLESEFSRTTKKAFSAPAVEVITPELEGENSQHVGVLNAFAAAILRGEPLIADGREGINGLMISNAMHLSSFENRMVELPFDEQRFYDLLMEKVKTSRRKVSVESVVSDTEGSYNS